MVTLKNIALKLNVSVGTVSKALRNSSEISEDLKQVVLACAKEMGYVANSSARSLKTNKSYNIGIVYEDKTSAGLGHDYFSIMLNSIRNELQANGFDFTFITTSIGEEDISYLNHAKYRNCDGVIIVTADFENKSIIDLVQSDIPVVTIDHVFENTSAILSDNEDGLASIVQYLYKKGHRKIAFIHGEDTEVTRLRLQAFDDTCKLLGIQKEKRYIKEAVYHLPQQAGQRTREILNLEDKPTCIIFPDDYSYMGGATEIDKHNLTVPDDISVVGYDGIFLSRILRPILTTYKQNSELIGETAVQTLLAEIKDPSTSGKTIIKIKGHLQEGQTVKDIK